MQNIKNLEIEFLAVTKLVLIYTPGTRGEEGGLGHCDNYTALPWAFPSSLLRCAIFTLGTIQYPHRSARAVHCNIWQATDRQRGSSVHCVWKR